ncbi:transposase [uncultured Muribaculum sp.]|uniref:transposase n=1 Tax=uncultured Muribaculum sp. TaxID=1918613 RepID=UPI002598F307|nr:transposase [uncultured Muribaculum sp.]
MSYVSSLFHVVFSTNRRQPVLNQENLHHLYAVIASEIKSENCRPIIINGTNDHIHILLVLHQSVALSHLMRVIKSKSSIWAKSSGLFPLFNGWEKEYGAFSISNVHKEAVYRYIEAQKTHHAATPYDDEYKRLIVKAGLTYYVPDRL